MAKHLGFFFFFQTCAVAIITLTLLSQQPHHNVGKGRQVAIKAPNPGLWLIRHTSSSYLVKSLARTQRQTDRQTIGNYFPQPRLVSKAVCWLAGLLAFPLVWIYLLWRTWVRALPRRKKNVRLARKHLPSYTHIYTRTYYQTTFFHSKLAEKLKNICVRVCLRWKRENEVRTRTCLHNS